VKLAANVHRESCGERSAVPTVSGRQKNTMNVTSALYNGQRRVRDGSRGQAYSVPMMSSPTRRLNPYERVEPATVYPQQRGLGATLQQYRSREQAMVSQRPVPQHYISNAFPSGSIVSVEQLKDMLPQMLDPSSQYYSELQEYSTMRNHLDWAQRAASDINSRNSYISTHNYGSRRDPESGAPPSKRRRMGDEYGFIPYAKPNEDYGMDDDGGSDDSGDETLPESSANMPGNVDANALQNSSLPPPPAPVVTAPTWIPEPVKFRRTNNTPKKPVATKSLPEMLLEEIRGVVTGKTKIRKARIPELLPPPEPTLHEKRVMEVISHGENISAKLLSPEGGTRGRRIVRVEPKVDPDENTQFLEEAYALFSYMFKHGPYPTPTVEVLLQRAIEKTQLVKERRKAARERAERGEPPIPEDSIEEPSLASEYGVVLGAPKFDSVIGMSKRISEGRSMEEDDFSRDMQQFEKQRAESSDESHSEDDSSSSDNDDHDVDAQPLPDRRPMNAIMDEVARMEDEPMDMLPRTIPLEVYEQSRQTSVADETPPIPPVVPRPNYRAAAHDHVPTRSRSPMNRRSSLPMLGQLPNPSLPRNNRRDWMYASTPVLPNESPSETPFTMPFQAPSETPSTAPPTASNEARYSAPSETPATAPSPASNETPYQAPFTAPPTTPSPASNETPYQAPFSAPPTTPFSASSETLYNADETSSENGSSADIAKEEQVVEARMEPDNVEEAIMVEPIMDNAQVLEHIREHIVPDLQVQTTAEETHPLEEAETSATQHDATIQESGQVMETATTEASPQYDDLALPNQHENTAPTVYSNRMADESNAIVYDEESTLAPSYDEEMYNAVSSENAAVTPESSPLEHDEVVGENDAEFDARMDAMLKAIQPPIPGIDGARVEHKAVEQPWFDDMADMDEEEMPSNLGSMSRSLSGSMMSLPSGEAVDVPLYAPPVNAPPPPPPALPKEPVWMNSSQQPATKAVVAKQPLRKSKSMLSTVASNVNAKSAIKGIWKQMTGGRKSSKKSGK
jgi:hypothetical protein